MSSSETHQILVVCAYVYIQKNTNVKVYFENKYYDSSKYSSRHCPVGSTKI